MLQNLKIIFSSSTLVIALFFQSITIASAGDNLLPEEEELAILINQARQDQGQLPLTLDPALIEAAQLHSEDMAESCTLSHTGTDGSTLGMRLEAAGFRDYSTASENVACGQATPSAVFEAWMGSTGHRANILNPASCKLGVGFAESSSCNCQFFWTADFGC